MNDVNFIVIEFRARWWVQPYIQTVAWFALTFGCEPNIEKIAQFLVRHGFRCVVAK